MRGEEGAGAVKGSNTWYPEPGGQSGDGEKCREVRGEFAAGRRPTSRGAVSHLTRPQLLSELVRVRRPRRWHFGCFMPPEADVAGVHHSEQRSQTE